MGTGQVRLPGMRDRKVEGITVSNKRHILALHRSFGMPAHQSKTLCGRTVNHDNMPNVPITDPRMCNSCLGRDWYLNKYARTRVLG